MAISVIKTPPGLRRLQRIGPRLKVGTKPRVQRARFKGTKFLKEVAKKRPVFRRRPAKR